jgi:hypothetical protein
MNQVSQPVSAARWIGRVIVAVLVGEGLWGLISALTSGVILPVLSRQMGSQTPQSVNIQLIFGAVISLCLAGVVAVLLNAWASQSAAGQRVVAYAPAPAARPVQPPASATLSINPSAAPAPAISKPVAPPPAPAAPAAFAAPPAPAPQPVPAPASQSAPVSIPMPQPQPVTTAPPPRPAAPPVTAATPAKPAAVAPPPKPAKPKPPREIQYNIVGEPISPMDDDD